MDQVKEYHGARIRTLLKTNRVSNSHHAINNDVSSSDTDGPNTPKTLSPVEIPEILLIILEYIPRYTYSSLCRVSKLWHSLIQPLIWGSLSCTDEVGLRLIAPHFSSNVDYIQKIESILYMEQKFRELSWLPRLFVDGRTYPNLTTICLDGFTESPETGSKESYLLGLVRCCPNLTEIDLRGCQLLVSYPLDFLYECPRLQSLYYDYPCWSDSIGVPPWENSPLLSAGKHWPNLRHLHINDSYELGSRALELSEILLKSSFCLESLCLGGRAWTQNVFRHLATPGPRSEGITKSQEAVASEPTKSMVSSLKLRDFHYSNIDFEEMMPRLTKLEIMEHYVTSGISKQLGEGICGRLVELAITESHLKELWAPLSNADHLRKLAVRLLLGNGLMDCSSAELPRWTCLGLQELSLGWTDRKTRDSESNLSCSSMALWEEIANLRQLRVLRLLNCKVISDESVTPCPLAMLKDLDQLRELEVTHSSQWTRQEVACVAEFWPRLSLFRYHLSKMSIFHWSWLRQMRPLLSMEDIEKIK